MPEPDNRFGYLKAFALLGQLGLYIALPILGGVLIGSHLDSHFSTGGVLTVVGILLGLVSGLRGAYVLIMKSIEDLKKNNKRGG